MPSQQRTGIWLAIAISFIGGLVLVLNDSAAGWMFFAIGSICLGFLTRGSRAWAVSNPRRARWGLVGTTVLPVFLVIIVAEVLLRC
jgi:hypothetical protein